LSIFCEYEKQIQRHKQVLVSEEEHTFITRKKRNHTFDQQQNSLLDFSDIRITKKRNKASVDSQQSFTRE
jgi:hypothetical protein